MSQTLKTRQPLTLDEARHHLTGPIASVHTPFLRDGELDEASLAAQIGRYLEAGSRTILMTVGNSHYFCLSDDEIARVTRIVCREAAGRAMVVAADRMHATRRAVEFARFAREEGADLVMCMPPDWNNSCTPATLAEHYATVAAEWPVMIVTNLMGPRGDAFGMEALRLSLDLSARIVAIKDDVCGLFAQKMTVHFRERAAIFAGGLKLNHLNIAPYGADGYMSTFIGFCPEITRRYWSCIEAGDMAGAWRITETYETPLFELMSSFPGDWNAGWHGCLELFGIGKRWRRPPYYSLNDEEMERLKDFFVSRRLL
ncbi:MAG TPA: dihydrodipicolinate synthase family protein [Candidatus Sumerlaeota bacterium]|nr:dihydrodipicolinate synthase family protein [Candidatus Sumerlaeota bacterium]